MFLWTMFALLGIAASQPVSQTGAGNGLTTPAPPPSQSSARPGIPAETLRRNLLEYLTQARTAAGCVSVKAAASRPAELADAFIAHENDRSDPGLLARVQTVLQACKSDLHHMLAATEGYLKVMNVLRMMDAYPDMRDDQLRESVTQELATLRRLRAALQGPYNFVAKIIQKELSPEPYKLRPAPRPEIEYYWLYLPDGTISIQSRNK